VGNFVVVQTVGCLTEGPSQSWTLTHATDPIVARPGAPLVGKDVQAGSQTFRLVSAGAYRANLASGRAVQVKGLLRRDPEGAFINLTDVAVLGAACAN
jgi:hypothetical protein